MKALIEVLTVKYPKFYGRKEVLTYRFYALLAVLFPTYFCAHCNRFRLTIERRHMSTCYCDEDSNYFTSCTECFDYIETFWAEAWDEYRSSSGVY